MKLCKRGLFRSLAAPLVCLLLAACGQEPVTDLDKALFVRAADLAEFGVRYPNPEPRESFSKAKQPDGAYELTYKFDSANDQRPLYIQSSITVGRKSSEAVLAESAERIGLLIAFKKNGVEERDVPGVRAGRLAILVKGDVPIGNVYTLREGDKTQVLIISGMYVRDAVLWHKLMGPKLEQLSRYQAKAS